MVPTGTRWKQCLENFSKVMSILKQYHAIERPSEIERGGIIQFFEVAFELSWKVMQDYLVLKGYSVSGPRDVIKLAFQEQMLGDAYLWLEALEDRNLTTHTYDEAIAVRLGTAIRERYYPMLEKLQQWMQVKAK